MIVCMQVIVFVHSLHCKYNRWSCVLIISASVFLQILFSRLVKGDYDQSHQYFVFFCLLNVELFLHALQFIMVSIEDMCAFMSLQLQY